MYDGVPLAAVAVKPRVFNASHCERQPLSFIYRGVYLLRSVLNFQLVKRLIEQALGACGFISTRQP